ncbi:hypothetical protein Enr10x_37770 [Gimesia panareensis]|uniref:Uncharacterized protein n=2 Tax=Gimesia panareensis TaxID=2527978 RepID=A0A517QA40_9PLAN|nr:hypothetical protein Enr10x_37770 [Gimesia panareensis]
MAALPEFRNWISLFFIMLWSVPASLSCWMLLKYRTVSLTIEPGTITVQGIFSRKVVDLADVQKVSWRIFPMGLRVYTTPCETASLTVSHFSPEDQVWLIRFFRQIFPEAIQENWPLYCLHAASRLRKKKHTVVPPPGPDEILITRQRYDRFAIPVILVSVVAAILMGILQHNFALLVLPLPLVMFWFLLRKGTPREGQIQKRLLVERDHRETFLLLGFWSVLLLGFIIIQRLDMITSLKNTWMLVLIVALVPAVIPVIMRTEKRRKQLDLIKAEQAMREWEVETAYDRIRNAEGHAG